MSGTSERRGGRNSTTSIVSMLSGTAEHRGGRNSTTSVVSVVPDGARPGRNSTASLMSLRSPRGGGSDSALNIGQPRSASVVSQTFDRRGSTSVDRRGSSDPKADDDLRLASPTSAAVVPLGTVCHDSVLRACAADAASSGMAAPEGVKGANIAKGPAKSRSTSRVTLEPEPVKAARLLRAALKDVEGRIDDDLRQKFFDGGDIEKRRERRRQARRDEFMPEVAGE